MTRGNGVVRVLRLGLRIEADEADREELADLAVQLREELLNLDVERVEPVSAGSAPPGTRAGEVLTAGALAVSLMSYPPLLGAVLDTVRSWVSRDRRRRVRLELDGDVLEVDSVSADEQRRLIDAWLAGHTAPVKDDAGR